MDEPKSKLASAYSKKDCLRYLHRFCFIAILFHLEHKENSILPLALLLIVYA